jgi:transposase
VLLAHPKKLRVIAESTRKSDQLDAQTLAEFLALDMIPRSFRPTPRQRDHRRYVRHRDRVQKRITSVKNRIRRILSDYNADRKSLFTIDGLLYLKTVSLSSADRFAMNQFLEEYEFGRRQLAAVESQLRQFADQGTILEQECRELLKSIPGVGFVTTEVVLAEIGDIQRFSSQKKVMAYAGLSPGQRKSAEKSQELHLEKNGSKLLRTAMIESAWRLIRHSTRWRGVYEQLKSRVRAKKAIVAVARRLLGVVTAILKSGKPYTHRPEA